MPETFRQVRRQPEESIVIEDFTGGMELRVATGTLNRIICNMYPRMDTKELEGIRGDYTYKHAMTAWAGSSEISWLYDLHNEHVAVFRNDETKFYILDNAGSPALTSHDNTTQYGTKAYAQPKYSSKRLSATVAGWLVHGNPWYGWYESVRGPSSSLGQLGGIRGAFQDSGIAGNPYRPPEVLSITEGGFYSSKTAIHTQQLGVPTPIATGLHISTSVGTALAGSRCMTSADPSNATSVKSGTQDWMGDRMNQWALCTDNGIKSPYGNLIHKFHFATNGYGDTTDYLVHNVYTQSGGQRIHTNRTDVSGAYVIDDTVTTPLACCSDSEGNIYVAFIKDTNDITVKKFAPDSQGRAGQAYTVTTQDVTGCTTPIGIKMGYDEYSERIFIFVQDNIGSSDYSGSVSGTSGNASLIRVFRIAKDAAPSTTANMGMLILPHHGYEVTNFTADFIADGYEGDNDLANANKKCLFAMTGSHDSDEELRDIFWGYFDTEQSGSSTTLLSMCHQTHASVTLASDTRTNPKNGGEIDFTDTHCHSGFALQIGTRSRKGPTCDVVLSWGSTHLGWDDDRTGIMVYKSSSCSVDKPDLSKNSGNFKFTSILAGYYAADKAGTSISHIGALYVWKDVSIPLFSYPHYTGTHTTGLKNSFPAHRGDCLNRLPRVGNTYVRYEMLNTSPNPLVKLHYDLETDSWDAYVSETEPQVNVANKRGSNWKQHNWQAGGPNNVAGEAIMPYEEYGVPPKPTGYPNDNTEDSLGCSLTPHWKEEQFHKGVYRTEFEADHESGSNEDDLDWVSIFYPVTDNNTPFLAYPSYDFILGEDPLSDDKEISIYCHPPIHGGAVYHNEIGLNSPAVTEAHRRDFGELRHNTSKVSWLKNNKLYAGANFHPLTPFVLDGGEKAKKVNGISQFKTWNKKDPILAGQDINVLTKVKTISGKAKPGKYRYKFSFAKAGAEEQSYRGTGGEGAIFWDQHNEAFFEWDSTRSLVPKGLRLYFNMGLLRKTVNLSSDYDFDEGTHLMELAQAYADGTTNNIEMKPIWDGTPGITMPLDKSHGPACRYDYWHFYDIMTRPNEEDGRVISRLVDEDDDTRISLRGVDEDSYNSDSRYGYRAIPQDPKEYGGDGSATFQHDTNGNSLSAGTQIYRHGKRTMGQTFESVSGRAPYVKKLIIWRTGNVDLPTTDKSKYYKVGEFELEDTDDSRGWSGYYFDDVFDTLELSGETADRDKLPPLTENITAMAAAGGRLFIAHNPQNKRDLFTASRTPSQIQFSGSHWENFPRKNVIILEESAVIHSMKAFQGNLFVFTDVGVYVVAGIDNPATMSSTKISEMVIHSNENDSETIIDVEGTLFCLGTDGLYQLIQGGIYKISKPMEEWFTKKNNIVPLGMYYDRNTQSVIVYDKTQSGSVGTIYFNEAGGTDKVYLDEVCYHLPTKSWWSKGNESANRRKWQDIVLVAHNTTASSQQSNTLPHSLIYGIKRDSETVDNIIQIGRGWGHPTTDNTAGNTGTLAYYYETAALGTPKIERYWDRVDVEVIPVENQSRLSINSAAVSINLDSFTIDSDSAYNSVVRGTNLSLTYKDLSHAVDSMGTVYESFPSLPRLIETANVDSKSEYARLRFKMTWHARANAQSFYPPRLKALRFRTRVIGVSREK